MATITNTLIQGLSQQMVQARLNSVDAKPFLFGTHFPVKKVNGFNWSTLTNQLESRNVAADLHTDGGTIIRKRRPLFETAKGDIPFLSISREMSRAEIKDYQTALAFAQDADASALVQYWGDDVDFCFNGIQSELEFIAWQLVSNAGSLAFTTQNNATYANEFNLDYGVADEMKRTVDWLNLGGEYGSASIIDDLSEIITEAKGMGLNPKFLFMSLNEFYRFASAEEIKVLTATIYQYGTGHMAAPDVDTLNSVLGRQAWLNGLQIRVIDQNITRELADGSRTSANPFLDNRVVLAESERLGTTQYDILQENDNLILRAERAHTVIKKYGTVEPKAEITIGQADATPVFDTAYRNIYIRTDNTQW